MLASLRPPRFLVAVLGWNLALLAIGLGLGVGWQLEGHGRRRELALERLDAEADWLTVRRAAREARFADPIDWSGWVGKGATPVVLQSETLGGNEGSTALAARPLVGVPSIAHAEPLFGDGEVDTEAWELAGRRISQDWLDPATLVVTRTWGDDWGSHRDHFVLGYQDGIGRVVAVGRLDPHGTILGAWVPLEVGHLDCYARDGRVELDTSMGRHAAGFSSPIALHPEAPAPAAGVFGPFYLFDEDVDRILRELATGL